MKKSSENPSLRSSAAEYLTFIASGGNAREAFEVRYEDENVWLTQKMLAALYDVGVPTINYHIRKIFEDGELQEFSVIRNFRITAADGKSYRAKHYSLQMILAVGFKVDSERAVQFRKWVNQIATTYTIKGWVMDDARLKRGGALTDKYFEEQLERVREIRASERKFYQKITTSTRPRSTTTGQRSPRAAFTRACRTRCTTPCTEKPPPSSSSRAPTAVAGTWG